MLPIVTLPKLRLVGLAPSVPGVTPVPESGMVRVGLDAFEVMAMLPLALPVAGGANETVKLALWPAVRVTGAVIPVKLNPLPVTET